MLGQASSKMDMVVLKAWQPKNIYISVQAFKQVGTFCPHPPLASWLLPNCRIYMPLNFLRYSSMDIEPFISVRRLSVKCTFLSFVIGSNFSSRELQIWYDVSTLVIIPKTSFAIRPSIQEVRSSLLICIRC